MSTRTPELRTVLVCRGAHTRGSADGVRVLIRMDPMFAGLPHAAISVTLPPSRSSTRLRIPQALLDEMAS